MSQTNAAVDPLTGDLTPARVYGNGTWTDTEGKVVAPGLAITRATPDSAPARYNLTHLGTGLGTAMRRCGQHILDAAALAVELGIDWTISDKDAITAAVKASSFAGDLRERIGWCCDDHCVGDGPRPPEWLVSCDTCHWTSEPGDSPLSAAEAKRAASDHRCEPEMSIRVPETGQWHDPWVVNDDGTVRDLRAKVAR